MTKPALAAAALITASLTAPAAAQEAFVGVLAHEVETPLTFAVEEEGVDVELGYRFGRQEALDFLGKPQPYLGWRGGSRRGRSMSARASAWWSTTAPKLA